VCVWHRNADRSPVGCRGHDASRQVEQYRVGRVLLAGDAAHIHLPAGGQGLNLGIQDAFNLGWKLAGEVHGWAPDGLLDSYHTERHPVGARVLENTRAQGALMIPDEDVTALRGIVADLIRLPEANRHLLGMISGLDVRYDMHGRTDHPLVGRRMLDLDLHTTRGSTRVSRLLHSGRGLLLDLGEQPAFPDVVGPWHPRVVHIAASTTQDIGTHAVLIRPDGHVCWAAPASQGSSSMAQPTAGSEELLATLTRWFGQAAPA
jgi:FAD binding domain/Aromatic-ring hydroxylase, C-terminal